MILGKKVYNESYVLDSQDNMPIRCGQFILPLFIITETQKTLDGIKIKAIQMHHLEDKALVWKGDTYSFDLPVPDEDEPILYGDINGDGLIDVLDVVDVGVLEEVYVGVFSEVDEGAVEEVIDEHYQNQINQIESDEKELRNKIIKFREDELNHKDIAYNEGATKEGFYSIFDKIIKTGSKLAIKISKTIEENFIFFIKIV